MRKRIVNIVIFVIAIMLLAMDGVGFSSVIITNVTGEIKDKGTITISGIGFGANGANVLVYDDFEKGTAGNVIRVGTGSAQFGKWDRVNPDSNKPHYSNAYSRSGLLSYWANCANGESATETVWSDLPSAQKDLYVSYWAFVPTGGYFPGESPNAVSGQNWKMVWPQGTNWTSDDNVDFLRLSPTVWYITGNGAPLSSQLSSPSPVMNKGEWTRFSLWIRGATDATGAAAITQLSASKGLVSLKTWNNVQTLKSGGSGFMKFLLNGFTRGDNLSNVYFDDVYVAYGPYARARVEIGTGCTGGVYAACTNLAISTPTAWSDTNIVATVRQENIVSGSAYLFVIDANGNVSAGIPVTIGGQRLSAPQGVSGKIIVP